MAGQRSDPAALPPWLRQAATADAIEQGRASRGMPPLPQVAPRTTPQVDRVVMERTEGDLLLLADGRRCRLLKRINYEISTPTGIEVRPEEYWRGPKQLGLIRSRELTPMGLLWCVRFGYPNHAPTQIELIHVAAAFLPDLRCVQHIATLEELEADPALVNLATLLEVPRGAPLASAPT